MDKEIREYFNYPPAGDTDCRMMSGWLSVFIRDDCSIDVYVEPDRILAEVLYVEPDRILAGVLSEPTEAQKRSMAQGTEFIFRVRCKNRNEAEKTARSIVDFITKPGLICMDLEDIRQIAAVSDHKANLWLFESFDDEPMEEFMGRIKTALPPLTSLNYMLQVEGDISLMDVYDLANMITDLSSEDANIAFQAQYHEETPGYKAFFVFSFEGENISQVQTEG